MVLACRWRRRVRYAAAGFEVAEPERTVLSTKKTNLAQTCVIFDKEARRHAVFRVVIRDVEHSDECIKIGERSCSQMSATALIKGRSVRRDLASILLLRRPKCQRQ